MKGSFNMKKFVNPQFATEILNTYYDAMPYGVYNTSTEPKCADALVLFRNGNVYPIIFGEKMEFRPLKYKNTPFLRQDTTVENIPVILFDPKTVADFESMLLDMNNCYNNIIVGYLLSTVGDRKINPIQFDF